MARGKRVVLKKDWGLVLVMDSAAEITQDEKGQIVIAGSHGADLAARYVSRFEPFGVILNDAGKGKDDAGISGLPILDAMDILGATVDSMSARIGEGDDNYQNGSISAINLKAKQAGLRVGMTVKEAAALMLTAKKQTGSVSFTSTAFQNESGRIILAASVTKLNQNHKGAVIVCGSHCAHNTYDYAKDIGLKGIFLNDAGKGKDNQGISGLPLYDRGGISACAIDCMSARIGDAQDAWESGIVSAVNKLAVRCGVREGMRVQTAAKKLLVKSLVS